MREPIGRTDTDREPTSPLVARFRASGRDQVAELVAEAFPTLRISIGWKSDDDAMRLKHDVVGDERLTHQRMSLTGRVDTTGDLGDTRLIGSPRRGGLEVVRGRTAVDSSRPFLYPEGEFRGLAEEYDIDLLAVRSTDLDRTARALAGDLGHRLRFTGSAPVSAAAERYWRTSHRHIASVLTDPAMLASHLIRGEALRTALRAALFTFPNTAMDAATGSISGSSRPAVDAATSFIEANAHRSIDLHDIAAAADTAPRSLILAFRKQHGCTPLQYLRTVRMERARADLAGADAWTTATVREIAVRWGFSQLGRFARDYRERFDELPSTTLRR